MNNKVLLKPCPFCGGKAELVYGYCDYNVWQVACQTDGCHGMAGWADTRDEAAEDWNRRIEPKPQWIPITDLLPEEDTENLVTCSLHDEAKNIIGTSKFYGYGESAQGFREFPDGVWDLDEIGEVLAWMPLPEPYTPAEVEDRNE